MDQVQVEIIRAELGKRIIEGRLDVLGRMEIVPELADGINTTRFQMG